jgi:hypothetical protein
MFYSFAMQRISWLFSRRSLRIPVQTQLKHSVIVELYLQFVIKPFLEFHDVFYASLNKFCRSQLDNAKKVPVWFTGMCRNFST